MSARPACRTDSLEAVPLPEHFMGGTPLPARSCSLLIASSGTAGLLRGAYHDLDNPIVILNVRILHIGPDTHTVG